MPLNRLPGLQFASASAKPEPGSDFRIYESLKDFRNRFANQKFGFCKRLCEFHLHYLSDRRNIGSAEYHRLLASLLFQHGQNIARRIFEPSYVGAITPMNAFFVGLDVALVALKTHASFREIVYSGLNIFNREVKYGEGCRDM